MIVGGIISGIGLVVMQLTKNTASTQVEAFNNAEYFSLRSEVESMLTNSFDCNASLTNTTFSGSSIRNTPIDVEIWHGDQTSARTRKFISGTDANFKKYGKLEIGEVKFSMPDYTGAVNFPDGAGSFKAEVIVRGSKIKFGSAKGFPDIKKSINIYFNSLSGVSTISGCALASGNLQIVAPGTGHDGQSGFDACSSIGGSCAYVQSHNYIRDDAGCPGATHCMRVCMTWYNQNLPGITNEVVDGKDNIHSCVAKVGMYTTYLDVGVVRCNAFFHAVCNM